MIGQVKESQKAYLTKSNVILVGCGCLVGNILLIMDIRDMFSENPFVYDNNFALILIFTSVIAYLAMLKKYKDYTK